MLIKPVKAAGGYPAKIYGGGTQAADRNPFADQAVEDIQRTIGPVQVGIGETRYQAGAADSRLFAHLYLFIIQRGAKPFLRKKEFIDEGVVYGSQYYFPILLNTDGYTAERKTMCKIDGPVDGIDDPFEGGVHDDLPGFLAQNIMPRVIISNDLENSFFRRVVCLRD